VHEGDVLIVTKLDRLARSMRDLLNIVARIEAKATTARIEMRHKRGGRHVGMVAGPFTGCLARPPAVR
jgi:hypothetical protein